METKEKKQIKFIWDVRPTEKQPLIKDILDLEFGEGVPSFERGGVTYHRINRLNELNLLSIEKLDNILHVLSDKLKSNMSVSVTNNTLWNFNVNLQSVEDNAKSILDKNPLYYDAPYKKWYMWNRKLLIWSSVQDTEIFQYVKQIFNAQGLSSPTNRSTLLNALKDETQSRKPLKPKDTWVQIGKTIYDIASTESYTPTPDYFIKVFLPLELGTSEETPFIDKLFYDWQGDNKDVLYDIAAYSISPQNFIDVFFFFQGGGSDGKSVFIKILKTIVGETNTKAVDLELVSDPKERFQSSFLIDKYLCLLGDGNFPVLKNTKFLKEASGNKDTISAELKGSTECIDFESKASIIGAFNTLPVTNDKTDGFFRRVHLTFWNNKYTGDRDVYTELVNKHPGELNNLLFKCLNRLRKIYVDRTIAGKLSVDETRQLYEEKSNPLRQFFKSEAKVDLNGVFSIGIVYNEYVVWAEKNRYNPFDFQYFKKLLGMQFYLSYQKTWVYTTNDGHCYRDENEIPDYKKIGMVDVDKNMLRVYRGMRLNSSLGDIKVDAVSEEFVS